jgi:diaminopimelate decarboxylase
MDCASEHEVRLALAAGVPAARVVYNSPALDLSLARRLYRAGGTVVADSAGILADISSGTARAQHGRGRLLVRVSPSRAPSYAVSNGWESLVAHSDPQSKFGIPEESLLDALAACVVPVDGFHLHVGTLMDDLGAFQAALALLHALRDAVCSATEHPLRVINLGGGLGAAFVEGQEAPSRAAFTASLRDLLRDDLEYLIEPGNALVADAVALITRVQEKKVMRGKTWAICDVGSDQLLKAAVMGWRTRMLHRGVPLASQGPDAVGGPLCFAGDVLLPQTSLDAVQRDDLLLVQHVGSYSYAVSNHFNGRLGPAHVLLRDDGTVAEVASREDGFYERSVLARRPAGMATAPTMQALSPEALAPLTSAYLRTDIQGDRYDLLGARCHARYYEFDVQAHSALGVVSLPFAVRIICDLGIVAVLHAAGTRDKDFPVWGTRMALNADQLLKTDQPVKLQVWISGQHSLAGEPTSYDVMFIFNDGCFEGTARCVY